MLRSMTGYGAGQVAAADVTVAVEVRSVNNRYLKLHTRMSDGYAVLEPRLEELVRQHIRRGSVQINLDIRRSNCEDDYRLNQEVLRSYLAQARELQQQTEDQTPVGLAALLGLPGVVHESRGRVEDAESAWDTVQAATEQALNGLAQMREVEGQAMGRDLTQQVAEIEQAVDQIEGLAPTVVNAYQTRLTERLNRMLAEHDVQVNPADVVREVGLFADRTDIGEEIVRLRSHLDQFRQIMDGSGGGRKLEFLVQELLRETNTIGSKANDAGIAKHVVQVKTCIERIREMVQNIE